ncbi:MAG: hypothetical protein SCARUB_04901 [Candidatus Scalindua rubra]|uniref:Uncharacterized protein n=1 Tax=Candidatus Scalindua rubra TaxID=1872076 RepID=A0A1E3X2X7_9BACT|nr:MAG: hypothetical protein SCARUB_04901 [Candidatus Scalindua rubra]
MDISTISDKVFQIGKLGKLPSFVLGCICWTFILLPIELLELLGITNLVENYRSYLGIGAILFPVYLISFIAYENSSGHLVQWIIIKRVNKRLRNLTEDEKDALRPYIDENKRTRKFRLSSGIGEGLVSKAILYRSSQLGEIGDVFPYNIKIMRLII